jgi:carbonic anhydrase
VLSCADSRVPVELIFDQSIGQGFVTRVAGNIATTATIASLEYGVAVLGTKAIIVLGHADCGAVKATIEAKAEPAQISALYPYIRPAVNQAGANLEGAVKANASIQASARSRSPVGRVRRSDPSHQPLRRDPQQSELVVEDCGRCLRRPSPT